MLLQTSRTRGRAATVDRNKIIVLSVMTSSSPSCVAEHRLCKQKRSLSSASSLRLHPRPHPSLPSPPLSCKYASHPATGHVPPHRPSRHHGPAAPHPPRPHRRHLPQAAAHQHPPASLPHSFTPLLHCFLPCPPVTRFGGSPALCASYAFDVLLTSLCSGLHMLVSSFHAPSRRV